METIAVILAIIIVGFTEFKKVGGIHFWRLGRIGGSFYIAKKKPVLVDE